VETCRPIRAETRATLVASIARGRRWLDKIVAGTLRDAPGEPVITEIVAVDPAALCQASTVTGYEAENEDGFNRTAEAVEPRRPQEKRGMALLIGRHNRLGARDDFGWRLVEPFDQRLYVEARHESELKVHLGTLGDKLRVAHRLGKGLS
jgi:hypothetical protein